jgi:hypothetical protein
MEFACSLTFESFTTTLFLFPRNDRNFRPFVFYHLRTVFRSLYMNEILSPFFSIASASFAKV